MSMPIAGKRVVKEPFHLVASMSSRQVVVLPVAAARSLIARSITKPVLTL
jgi:hypothetical protein